MRSNKENGTKFRTAVAAAVCSLLDNCEFIQKWQGSLETASSAKTENKTNEPLGQFLRLLHYAVIAMLLTETDSSMIVANIKLANTLLHQTPYGKMLPGLATSLIQAIIDLLPSSKAIKSKLMVPCLLRTLETAFTITIGQDQAIKNELNTAFV